MIWLRPGDTLIDELPTTDPATGGQATADTEPSFALIRNGVADMAVTFTTANIVVGGGNVWRYSCVIPTTYLAGDIVWVRAVELVPSTPTTLSVIHRLNYTRLLAAPPAAPGAVTPSAPPQTTGYATVYDQDGLPFPGVDVSCEALDFVAPAAGVILAGGLRTEASGGTGLIQFPRLFEGARYRFQVLTGLGGPLYVVEIPTGTSGSYALPDLRGG